MKPAEVYEAVTAAVIRSIEEGIANPNGWRAPWSSLGSYPTNASTGNAYRGGNVLWLSVVAAERGYAEPWWGTYRQWAGLHRQVNKGEKCTYGVKWVFPDPEAVKAARAKGEEPPRAFPRSFSVFAYAQTVAVVAECTDLVSCGRQGAPLTFTDQAEADAHEHEVKAVTAWTPPVVEARDEHEIDRETLAFFGRVGSTLHFGGDRAYYDPSRDAITVPVREAFHTPEGFAATVAHEHAHWTGHESRLDRKLNEGVRFGGEGYAAEELVAELGAAFLCARLGFEAEPREDHFHYLANWLRVLRNDPKAIYTASSLAQAAADYIFVVASGEVPGAVPEQEVAA